MVTVVASEVFVCKGKDNEPGLKYAKNGQAVQFNISWKVYDPNAEGESRLIFYHVKAFGQVCERIKKMNVKEGSCINFVGRLDEDVWEDRNTGGINHRNTIILSDIEYARSGGKSKDGQGTDGGNAVQSEGGQNVNTGGAPAQRQMAQGQAVPQMAPQGNYAPQGFMPNQMAPQNVQQQMAPQNAQQQAAPQMAPQNAQQQAAPQMAPQNAQQQAAPAPQGNSTPQPVGTAADFAGFTGYAPYEGSNMFPT